MAIRTGQLDSGKSGVKAAGWAVACVFAVAVFSAAICGWLSEPVCYRVLWPDDIHHGIVRILGGTTSISMAGKPMVVLSWVSVVTRLLGAFLLAGVVVAFSAKIRKQWAAGCFPVLLRRLTVVLLVSTCWWGLWVLAELGSLAAGKLALGLLPVWLMATGGIVIWAFGQAGVSGDVARRGPTENLQPQQTSLFGFPFFILCAATICWVGISFWLNHLLYDQLMIPHGDSAMYEEHLWNVWHGKGFRSYLDQGLFLGEHVQVIHLLLLPLHWIWPSHLLLELTESLALGSCALMIFGMTLRHTGSRMVAMWMGLAWLCYFPMHFLDIAIDQKTFRPIVLGLPFLFGMIYYGERGHFGKTLICLLIALSAKEDVALVACPILAVLAIQHRLRPAECDRSNRQWKLLLGLSIATAAYLVVTVLVVIPAFRSGEHVHYARYFGSLGNTPGELIRTALKDPLAVAAQAFRVQTFVYLAVFLVPLALLPVRRVWVLSSGVITFSMLALLQFSTDGADLPPVPYHHFHAPLLPVIFWAAICAIGNAGCVPTDHSRTEHSQAKREGTKSWLPSMRLSAVEWSSLAFSCCLLTSFTSSLSPLGASFWSAQSSFGYRQLYNSSDTQRRLRAESIDAIVSAIPSGARVASTDYVHTRLTHHERSYDYSDYLRAVNGYQPGVPADTDFIVLDLAHPYSRIRTAAEVPELNGSDNEWVVRSDLSNSCFLVLERTRVEGGERD